MIFSLVACGKQTQGELLDVDQENAGIMTETSEVKDTNTADIDYDTEANGEMSSQMILKFDDKEIPVIWEDNDSVRELKEQAALGNITVSMSMYGGNEQVVYGFFCLNIV